MNDTSDMTMDELMRDLSQPALPASGTGDDGIARLMLQLEAHYQAIRDQLDAMSKQRESSLAIGDSDDPEALRIEPGTDLHRGARLGFALAAHLVGEFPVRMEKRGEGMWEGDR